MAGLTVILDKKKETRGYWAYEAIDKGALVTSIYIRKTSLSQINNITRIALHVSGETVEEEEEGHQNIRVALEKTKETKGTWVYAGEQAAAINKLYVKKKALEVIGKQNSVTLTVKPYSAGDGDGDDRRRDEEREREAPSTKKRKTGADEGVSLGDALQLYVPLLRFSQLWNSDYQEEREEFLGDLRQIYATGEFSYQNTFGEDGRERLCNFFSQLPRAVQKKLLKTASITSFRKIPLPPRLDESGEQTGDMVLGQLDEWITSLDR